jgi:DNA-binding LacI/PurR family transcriptional regulator
MTELARGVRKPPSRPSRMKDVARLAGVSHTTVWRVLNHGAPVDATTRERILNAIRALDYRPNPAARALSTRHSNTLGVITTSSARFGSASMVHGFEQAARAAGYFVTMTSVDVLAHQSVGDAMTRLHNQGVDGIAAFLPPGSASIVARAAVPIPPLIAVGATGNDDIPTVATDTAAGATMATDHLLRLGHTTVHHVAGPSGCPEARIRQQAWQDALRAARAPVPTSAVGDWTARSGYEAGRRLARDRCVTAVFCANDHMALGVLRALSEAGRHVPGDISVVGFDDIPEAAYTNPPLTTVRQDFAALGRLTMALLAGFVTNTASGSPTRTRLIPQLEVRGSSGP